jgi:hypothetical protein
VTGTAVAVALHLYAIIAAEVIVKPVDRVYVSTSLAVVAIALFMHPNPDQTEEVPAVIYCWQEAPALDLQKHFVAVCHHVCVATALAV